jgi:hypothetical protein
MHALCIAFHTSKCRYLPVALFALAWVNTKIHTANESMPLSKRFGDMARMLRRRVLGEETHLHESVEMQSESMVCHTMMIVPCLISLLLFFTLVAAGLF